MQDILHSLGLVLLYTGILWVVVLIVVMGLVHGRLGLLIRGIVGLGQAATPLSWLGAVAAQATALALLPWPMAAAGAPRPNLWLLWGLIEASQLLWLLPALSHADPQINRLATREAQLTMAGRAALWLGVSVAWSAALEGNVVARAVATVAGLLALPLALNWPPFGPAKPSAWTKSLPRPTHPVAALLLTLRETTLLALAATFMVVVTGVAMPLATLAQVITIIALAAIGRGLRGTVVEQRLHWGLRWWWNLLVPLAVVGVLLLALQL
ncbi:MAG: hypothetical protein H0X37_06710 [Herpetosiphonaceae bacterium]|nr:hypothetical protein [Herpetosiphonaceae bacterium]